MSAAAACSVDTFALPPLAYVRKGPCPCPGETVCARADRRSIIPHWAVPALASPCLPKGDG